HYACGNPQFDDFFLALYRMQVEMARAPDDLAEARAEVADVVNAASETSSKQLAEKVHGELQKLVPRGIRVKIEVQTPEPTQRNESAESEAPEPSALVRHSGRPNETDRRLLTRLEASTTRVARLAARMRRARERLNGLRLIALQLEGQVDQAFDLGKLEKRREVRANLEDGIKVIALMTERAERIEQRSTELLDAIVSTGSTDDGTVALESLHAKKPRAPERTTKKSPRPARPRPRDDADDEPAQPEPKSTEFDP
ncbi:MAG: hypothetical protein DIU78_016815, partial [Pseudomonadota bacterium]